MNGKQSLESELTEQIFILDRSGAMGSMESDILTTITSVGKGMSHDVEGKILFKYNGGMQPFLEATANRLLRVIMIGR
jgi:hypothetical protein